MKTSEHADIKIAEWKQALEESAKKANIYCSVEFVAIKSQLDDYVLILNPYGGIYPEEDLKRFSSLEKIVNFVREGGMFVNVADIPTYFAYNSDLGRRLEVARAVWATTPAGQPFKMRPFELTPLPQELDLRIIGSPSIGFWQVSLSKVLGPGAPVIEVDRLAIIESNIENCVDPISAQYMDGNQYNMTPLFFTHYDEGEFLFSLIWFDRNSIPTKKDALIKAICKISIDKIHSKTSS